MSHGIETHQKATRNNRHARRSDKYKQGFTSAVDRQGKNWIAHLPSN